MEQQEYNSCLNTFIQQIQQELTVGCQIPVSIPQKELLRIIEQAKKWFYKNYPDSLEEKFYFIHEMQWSTESYKLTAAITLPEKIFSVIDVYETHAGWNITSAFGLADGDFTIGKWMYSKLDGGPGIASDSLMYYTIMKSLVDLSKMMLVSKLAFEHNRLNHNFRFLGRRPKKHAILRVLEKIEDCALFSDEIFTRYIIAQCKLQMARVLGMFDYNLPGGIKINYDSIKDEGKEELDAIKTEIKEDEGLDYFFSQ
jgi:hypothetical protein